MKWPFSRKPQAGANPVVTTEMQLKIARESFTRVARKVESLERKVVEMQGQLAEESARNARFKRVAAQFASFVRNELTAVESGYSRDQWTYK